MSPLVSILVAMSAPAAGPGPASIVGPPDPLVSLRWERLEPRDRPRTWRGVDVVVRQSRLNAGATLAIPRDARAVTWRRDEAGVEAADVEGTVRIIARSRVAGVDAPRWDARIELRPVGAERGRPERATLRQIVPGLDPASVFPSEVRRLLVVIPERWESEDAILQRFERSGAGGAWRTVGSAITAAVGRRGVAWGRGLHGEHPRGPALALAAGQAPAGVFLVRVAAGAIVLEGGPGVGDVTSVVAWQSPGRGTEFQIGVPPEALGTLVPWVAPEERVTKPYPGRELVKVAVTVVLPRDTYRRLAAVWGLPPAPAGH